MDLKQYFGGDDRGVSPVIGVILMVAITVILAAVIATFVMNMGPSESTPANANWDLSFENNESFGSPAIDYIELTHEGGGDATASEYSLAFEGVGSDDIALDDAFDGGDALSASDSIAIYNSSVTGSTPADWDSTEQLSAGDVQNVTQVQLIWNDPEGDQSQVINTWDN